MVTDQCLPEGKGRRGVNIKGQQEGAFGVMKLFCILMVVMVIYFKNHRAIHQK